jgi:hypothetical protein
MVQVLWKGTTKRVTFPSRSCVCAYKKKALRVGLFGNAVQNGWYISSKAKYRQETDSEQVP